MTREPDDSNPSATGESVSKLRDRVSKMSQLIRLTSLRLVFDKHCVTLTKKWVYPTEKFWTYIPSPETERWCRFFGYGHWESANIPQIYLMGDTILAHPFFKPYFEEYRDDG